MPSTHRLRATTFGAVLAAAGLALSSGHASAQDSPIVVEARGGAAIPVGAFADGTAPGEGATAGPSFGVDIAVAGGGRWTPYVGFSQHRFGCEDAGCAAGGEYVATGFHAGARFVPMPGWAVLPWLGGGVVTTHVEAADLGPTNAGLSELGVGGEVTVGVHIGSASRIALSPSLRWVMVSPGLPSGTDLEMRYLIADVGVVLSF
jgi:hypothetical protein